MAAEDEQVGLVRDALLQSKAVLVENSLRQRAGVYRAWVSARLLAPDDGCALLRTDAMYYSKIAPGLLEELETLIRARVEARPKRRIA